MNVPKIETDTREFVRRQLKAPYRVLQLGSKPWVSFGQPWADAGAEVVGIDLDGRERCRRIDLCKPVPEALVGGRFEVVTNYGCTEHVENQAQVWRTIHELLKPGGYLISTVPTPGHYRNHGMWYPSEAWYREWAELNGYEFLRFEVLPLTVVVARKLGDRPFTMPKTPIHLEHAGDKKAPPALFAQAENL